MSRTSFYLSVVIALSLLFGALWVTLPKPTTIQDINFGVDSLPTARNGQAIQPILLATAPIVANAKLGERLFNDPRLSKSGKQSCNSCHNLLTGGTRPALDSDVSKYNIPSVFNSINNFRYNWDGRTNTIEQLIDESIVAPFKLANSWPAIMEMIRNDEDYSDEFAKAFPDQPLTKEVVSTAIIEFLKTLVTPNSIFDQYLLGKESSLTSQEKKGYELFKTYGCVTCHQGKNVGGNLFQVFGVVEDYFPSKGTIKEIDLGRYNVTGLGEDKYHFRVPSLRNVAITSPYFHDGSVSTLEAAVIIMAKYQLGRNIPIADVHAIASFLKTLTGEYKGEPL